MKCFKAAVVLILTSLLSCTSSQNLQKTESDKVLVLTKTEGFRHTSIETGVELIKSLALKNNYKVVQTEDATFLESPEFIDFDAVVFLSTTGDIFNSAQQEIFEKYIQQGGGFVGIHAAADTEYERPWYGKMVGGYFESHPNDSNVLTATINKSNHEHPSTSHLDDTWVRSDEWYNYKNLNFAVTTLLTLDESSYEGGTNIKG